MVVLIIGILAAVAVPQYKMAVMKSRVQSLYPIIATLRSAEEAYYLANGQYTEDYDALDISLPCKSTAHTGIVSCGKDVVIDLFEGTSPVIIAHYCPELDVSTDAGYGACISGTKRVLHLHWSMPTGSIGCYSEDTFGTKVCSKLFR